MKNLKTKLLIATLVMLLCCTFAGCSSTSEEPQPVRYGPKDSPFIFIGEEDYSEDFILVYHEDTKVMYAVSIGLKNQGSFTVLVNADGSPMLYDEEK